MRALVIVMVATTLSACSGLMLGGGASSSAPAAKDRPANGPRASDVSLSERVRERYANDPVVSQFDLGVRSNNGMLTLSGTVGSYAARETAEKLAMATDGVQAVDNQIIVRYAK